MGLFTFLKTDGFRGWTTLQLPRECTTINISPDAKESKQKVRHEDNHLLPLMRIFPREVKQRPSPHASPTLQIEVAPDSRSYYFICGPAYSNPVSAWLVFHGAPGSKLRKLINVWRLNCHLPR